MKEDGSSRRDLFRLFGRSFADAARRGAGRNPPASAPADEARVERGRLVVDLAGHPLVPGEGRRFRGVGAPEVVLLVRVDLEHFAAVSGDCPRCGGPLSFDRARDAALCAADGARFRMDGALLEGPGGPGLRSYACSRLAQRVEIGVFPL